MGNDVPIGPCASNLIEVTDSLQGSAVSVQPLFGLGTPPLEREQKLATQSGRGAPPPRGAPDRSATMTTVGGFAHGVGFMPVK